MTDLHAGPQATATDLQAALEWIRQSPRELGSLDLIVRRPGVNEREALRSAALNFEEGLAGDSWRARAGGSPTDPDKQLTLMNSRVAALVAGHPDRRQLAGDQLYVDLDLSVGNAPAGTRLAIGDAVVELTAPPHLGCAKFVARFGEDAMRFVNSSVGRSLRLRGANARVIVPGRVCVGDEVRVLERGGAAGAGG